MCGVAGIIKFSGEIVCQDELSYMGSAMAHRGPDGEGFYINGNIGLAHRRLAIIDPDEGHQPYIDEESGLVLVYNGEIYNYVELREELKNEFIFKTSSDTEVLIKSFAKWGIACLEKLRGMFVFALYDIRRKKLYIVRDRLGIKPLYFCKNKNNDFYFASELSSIKISGMNKIDITSVADYFRWQYVPTPKSIYKGVYKLEPGHYIELDTASGGIKKECYWKLKLNVNDSHSEEEWLDKLNNELYEIIRMYVRSDVPFGAFLSGGVDSSLITALMSSHLNMPVKTFTIGFDEHKHSELPFAREAAMITGSDHFQKIVTSQAAIEIIEKIVKHFGEPFADSSAIPTYYVSQITAEKVKMVLSGDGGDELFAGYWSYVTSFTDRLKQNIVLRKLLRKFLSVLPRSGIKSRLYWYSLTHLEKHLKQREIFTSDELAMLLGNSYDTDWPYTGVLCEVDRKCDFVSRFQYLDARTYMMDDVLTKVDRMSMANSLEVRVPLLDHKLVELAFQMPLSVKLRLINGKIRTKHILKRSAERFFTPEFLDRPKMGFGIPVVEWCQVDLKDYIIDSFADKDFSIFNYINYDYVQRIIKAFYSGRTDYAAKVWALLIFNIWIKSLNEKDF